MLIGAIEQMKCKMHDHQTLNKSAGSSMLAPRTSTPSLRLPMDETGSSYSHLGDGLMTPRSQFSISESYQSPVESFLSDPCPQHLAFSAADLPLRTGSSFSLFSLKHFEISAMDTVLAAVIWLLWFSYHYGIGIIFTLGNCCTQIKRLKAELIFVTLKAQSPQWRKLGFALNIKVEVLHIFLINICHYYGRTVS